LAAFGRLSGECPQTHYIVATLRRRTEMVCPAALHIAWKFGCGLEMAMSQGFWRIFIPDCLRQLMQDMMYLQYTGKRKAV